MMTTDELACYDASCAPPPVGTGGSKPGGPARGVLSPKASERTRVPVPVTTSNYELRKHGLRELFDGPIGGGLEFSDDTDVQWLGDDKGWFIEGSLRKGGENVGYFERYIGLKGGKLVATHETLILEEQYQGKGYAKAFNDHLLAWYQKVGVDRIELRAGFDMGPFVWATQGYRIQGVEGGENRKRWVDNRLKQIEERDDDPELRTAVRALRKANDRGEDIQPIHVASIGQDDPRLHWQDEKYGDMWPGKDVLIEEHYQNSDRTREWDGVYYLEGREVPAIVASAQNFLSTRAYALDTGV
jgi:GNAT superfamily N-acetyltransferase